MALDAGVSFEVSDPKMKILHRILHRLHTLHFKEKQVLVDSEHQQDKGLSPRHDP